MTFGRRRLLAGGGLLAAAVAACGGSSRDGERRTPSSSSPSTSTDQDGRVPGAPQRIEYGIDPSQFVELSLPATSAAQPVPVVVIIHGGFWRDAFDLSLGRPLAGTLPARGLAALNIEYRRVGNGGGDPATLDDVAAAIDTLAGPAGAAASKSDVALDLERVVTVGHSAGGHLAVWAATRTAPAVALAAAVSQAGVLDLRTAAADRLGGGAVQAFLGGEPDELGDRYDAASPIERLPVGVPVLCVHGRSDTIVPLSQSEGFVEAALAAGDDAELTVVDGDHFVVIDPAGAAWTAVLEWIDATLNQ